MAKDILSEYGSDSPSNQKAPASNGGHILPKELPYDPPKGPSAQHHQSPGLHGDNHGNCGTQGKH